MIKEKHLVNHYYGNHQLARYIDVYEVTTDGCSSSPMSGYKGTEATLIDQPVWNEKFSSWSLTGATVTGNNYVINNDVTAKANYETAKNVTLQTDGHGTIAANKMSGFIGDQVTLSNTPDSGYVFSSYDLTGATLTGNKFNFIGNDVTARANFEYVGNSGIIYRNTGTWYIDQNTNININANFADNPYIGISYSMSSKDLTNGTYGLEFRQTHPSANGSFYIVAGGSPKYNCAPVFSSYTAGHFTPLNGASSLANQNRCYVKPNHTYNGWNTNIALGLDRENMNKISAYVNGTCYGYGSYGGNNWNFVTGLSSVHGSYGVYIYYIKDFTVASFDREDKMFQWLGEQR